MESPIRAACNPRTGLSSSSRGSKEEKLTSYWEVVSYLPAAYASDEKLVESDMDIMSLKNHVGQCPEELVQAF